MTSKFFINRPCPCCKSLQACYINKNKIQCQDCDFEAEYTCPLCNKTLKQSPVKEDSNGEYIACVHCNHNKLT